MINSPSLFAGSSMALVLFGTLSLHAATCGVAPDAIDCSLPANELVTSAEDGAEVLVCASSSVVSDDEGSPQLPLAATLLPLKTKG